MTDTSSEAVIQIGYSYSHADVFLVNVQHCIAYPVRIITRPVVAYDCMRNIAKAASVDLRL